jgi:hypothetical protein
MRKADLAAAREDLLQHITAFLKADSRFAAAWLAGSLGRDEGDMFSDIDIFVVVEDAACPALCARPRLTSGTAPEARMALFRTFGEPANIHENQKNAPPGGSFSAVLYHQPPVMVDWALLPRSLARRPTDTRLLFARAGILTGRMEVNPAADRPLGSAAEQRAERLAFFWMMAAIAAKYIARGAAARDAAAWVLPFMANEIAGSLEREPAALYSEGPPLAQLRELCDTVEAWQGEPAPARAVMESILRTASENGFLEASRSA